MDSTDDDDLFATLGGSLMSDLLADLNDDADASFLSLEQLEKELAHLDSKPYGSLPTVTEETPSAASMVVAAQQQNQGSLYGNALESAAPAIDAWSLSLQKFTAASLEEDFLQANSVRKALHGAPSPVPPTMTASAPPGLEQLLSKAEEYDVQERLLVRPPPGLGKNVAQQVAEKLESSTEEIPEAPPMPRQMPATPQNSLAFELPLPPKPAPPTPQNSVTISDEGVVMTMPGKMAPPPLPGVVPMAPPPGAPPMGPGVPPAGGPPPPMGSPPPQGGPAPPSSMHMPPTPPNSMHVSPHPREGAPHPMAPLTAVPVAMPMGHGPPAQGPWQGMPPPPPPPQIVPPPRPVYANPHPDAPPIPAQALATPFMTVRDISYVVHSILKPILALGTSPFDYDQVYWRRRGQGLRSGKKAQAGADKLEKEMKSRGEKAKEWSDQHATLGKSAKTNVARPRSLIAQPVAQEGTPGGEERQRQTLWKARIYCDQAYQAYMQVVEAWERSPGTAVPANLQPHLVKLLRCLGISLKEDGENKPAYAIDPSGLSLLLKLAKGRVLLARLLEQALLPPASVQVLLPRALEVLYQSSVPKQDPVDDRVFAALARVINSLPDLTGTCITQGTQVILKHTNEALQSTSRMQAVHGLLRRGSMLAASNPDFGKDWSQTEAEFMKVLGGM